MLKNHVSNISPIPTRSHNAPAALDFWSLFTRQVSTCAKARRLLGSRRFLRHVRPSIVCIDLSPPCKPHTQTAVPRTGCGGGSRRWTIYMGGDAAVASLAKTVSDLGRVGTGGFQADQDRHLAPQLTYPAFKLPYYPHDSRVICPDQIIFYRPPFV